LIRRLKIYLDTSVLGGIFDIEDSQRMKIVQQCLKKIKRGDFEVFISRLTIQELMDAPLEIKEKLIKIVEDIQPKILEETEESLEIAEAYINEGIIPEKFRDDARHIAIVSFYEIDFLVSWNYHHMVNIKVKKLVNAINLRLGYKLIEIVPPEEVVEYGEMEL